VLRIAQHLCLAGQGYLQNNAGNFMRISFLLVFTGLLTAGMPAEASELNGGVSLGGFLVGTVPRFAVSPHIGMSWRRESGFLFMVHDMCSILPTINTFGAGIYNQASAAIGYSFDKLKLSIGPSISIYSTPACGITLCGRVVGVAPGGHLQIMYFAGAMGVSVRANIDWVGGRSLVLPGGVAAMVTAGPVLRWISK
jgi:hypothetical protein